MAALARSHRKPLAEGCGLLSAAAFTHTTLSLTVSDPASGPRPATEIGGGDLTAAASSQDLGRLIDGSTNPRTSPCSTSREGALPNGAALSRAPTAIEPIPRAHNNGLTLTCPASNAQACASAPRNDAGLRIVCANVQRSRDNMHVLLDRYRDADVICIQEPCWTFVKVVASSSSPEGDPTFDTAHHRNFITLGAAESSRVVTYVHRERWASASPRVRASALRHDDAMCVTLNIAGREVSFLNVYNDPKTHAAVTAITHRAAELPPIVFMAGDFNIRHPTWDKYERRLDRPGSRHLLRHVRKGEELIALATDHLGLVLVNDPNGPPTWYSNNVGVREGILDLIWADPDLACIPPLRVNDLNRHDSDHAVLEWTLPVAADRPAVARVPRDSALGHAFVQTCREGLASLPCQKLSDYHTRDDVVRTASQIEAILRDAWQKCAVPPKPCGRSKSWWNAECSAIAKAIRGKRTERKSLKHVRTDIQTRLRRAGHLFQVQWVSDIRRLTRMLQELDEAIKILSKRLKGAIRHARGAFFRDVIRDTKPSRVWDLVGWTRPRPMGVTEGIVDAAGSPVEDPIALGAAFQEQFTPANPRPVDMSLLDEIEQLPERQFDYFSPAELGEALAGTSDSSAPGPDCIGWHWLKRILAQGGSAAPPQQQTPHSQSSAEPVVAFFNACVVHSVQPDVFKVSKTVVIPKPNKPDYSRAKAYRPIVLLNCLGKLFEKMLARRLQFDGQKMGIMHPCQFGGTMQHGTVDAGQQLVHNIKQAWRLGMDSSALLLDLAQFFPSINHTLLAGILRKQGFPGCLCEYFEDYLVGRHTQFIFNGATLPPQEFSTGVGQGSALSPVLTGLFLAPVLHIVAATSQTMNLRIGEGVVTTRSDWTARQLKAGGHATVQFYVDDGLIHVAGKLGPGAEPEDQLKFNVVLLQNLFNRLATYLARAGLGIESDKLELMHFIHRRRKNWREGSPLGPAVRVKHGGSTITIQPSASMRYLGFYLDPTLSFKEHVRFYATRGSSTVHTLRMLGNSKHGLAPHLRRLLYLSNVVPLLTYGAALWWSPSWKGVKGFAKTLQKAQSKAARWITGGFRTTPVGTLEALAGLVPIKSQVNKLVTSHCLRARTLHGGHPTRAHMPARWSSTTHNISSPFPLSQAQIRNPRSALAHVCTVADALCQEEFDATHDECRPGARLVDKFHARVSAHLMAPKKGSDAYHAWVRDVFRPQLAENLADNAAAILFTDGSVMEDRQRPGKQRSGAGYVVRTPTGGGGFDVRQGSLGCGNVTPFDAELVALAKGVSALCSRVCADDTVRHVHIYTDNRAALAKLLNPAVGPSQMCAVLACKNLRRFLESSTERRVHLHWCPAHSGVTLNELVDDLAKAGAEAAQPDFTSLARARQEVSQSAHEQWKTDLGDRKIKGRQSLLRPNLDTVTFNSANWFMRHLGKHPRELARFTRMTSGHLPCGAYRARFHLPGPSLCWWCKDVVETRDHILFQCPAWSRCYDLARSPRALQDWEVWERWRTRPHEGPAAQHLEDELAEALSMSDEELRFFLRINPMAGSFAWSDLVERAQADERSGLTAQTSSQIFRANAHSGWRRRERWLWLQRLEDNAQLAGRPLPVPTKLEQMFCDWYATCMARFIVRTFPDAGSELELLREFGHSRAAEKPGRLGEVRADHGSRRCGRAEGNAEAGEAEAGARRSGRRAGPRARPRTPPDDWGGRDVPAV